jgi:hypothetical protein
VGGPDILFLPPVDFVSYVLDRSVIVDLTWMFILELRQIVNIFIDHNVQVTGLIVRRYIGSAESLGHDEDL